MAVIPTDRAEADLCEGMVRRGLLVRDLECSNMRFKLPDAAPQAGTSPSTAA